MTEKASRVTEEQKRVWGGLPPAVKVGNQLWHFEFQEDLTKDDGRALFGETQVVANTIVCEVNQGFGQARDTVLHELQHAIYSNTTLHASKSKSVRLAVLEEESIIRTTTPWLLMLLKDNPELVAWLTKDETEGEER